MMAALETGAEFEGIYVDDDAHTREDIRAIEQRASGLGVRVFALSPGVLEKIADAQTPQPVIGAVRFRATQLEEIEPLGCVVVAHEMRDPGNAGTIIRSADSAGATAVIFTGRSVDPYNAKTLRATAGSAFHLPMVVAPELSDVVAWAHEGHAHAFAAVVRGGENPRAVDLSGDCVIVVGNEATGLSRDDETLCDRGLSIPMAGKSESLNAGVAASLLMFEALEQRQSALSSSNRPTIEG